jgi:putative transposase
MTRLITLKQLAQLTDEVNWQTVYNNIRRKAARGKYKTYALINGKGHVSVDDPEVSVSVRLKYSHQSNVSLRQAQTDNTSVTLSSSKGDTVNSELSRKQLQFALASARLVTLFIDYQNQPRYTKSKVEAQLKFVEAYNNKAFLDVYEIIGERAITTLRSWQTKYLQANKDYRVLAPNYKTNRQSCVTKEEAEILHYYYLSPNQPLISEVIRDTIKLLEVKRIYPIKAYNTYKRFLENWIKNNQDKSVFWREGKKAFWDKVMPYLPRNWKRIEVGDIIIMDGHHNNYEILNCFPNKKGYISGRPKRMMTVGAIDGRSQFLAGYEIAPTENVLAIASAFRRSILQLGMVPKYVYIDNGKAFLSKLLTEQDCEMLESLFSRLQVITIIAKKYHPQSKPIEPFWKWMAELERKIPTYVGTSISKQPPRLHRGEFEHRALYEKAMDNICVDIFSAHDAMAIWLDEYHNRTKVGGHLKGTTPAEVFNLGRNNDGILLPDRKTRISKKELNYLMMSMKVTKLYRNGIRAFGTWYFHEDLFGKQVEPGDNVFFKYSLFEKDSIIVYNEHGEELCEAFKWDDFHPIAKMGTEEDQSKLKMGLAIQARLEKSVTGQAQKFKQEEIYPFVKKQLSDAKILQLPESSADDDAAEEKALKRKSTKKNISDRWSLPEEGIRKAN